MLFAQAGAASVDGSGMPFYGQSAGAMGIARGGHHHHHHSATASGGLGSPGGIGMGPISSLSSGTGSMGLGGMGVPGGFVASASGPVSRSSMHTGGPSSVSSSSMAHHTRFASSGLPVATGGGTLFYGYGSSVDGTGAYDPSDASASGSGGLFSSSGALASARASAVLSGPGAGGGFLAAQHNAARRSTYLPPSYTAASASGVGPAPGTPLRTGTGTNSALASPTTGVRGQSGLGVAAGSPLLTSPGFVTGSLLASGGPSPSPSMGLTSGAGLAALLYEQPGTGYEGDGTNAQVYGLYNARPMTGPTGGGGATGAGR